MVVDILIGAYVLGSVFLGWRYGLFRRLLQFLAFCLGLFLAGAMSVPIAQNLGFPNGKHPVAGHFAVYLGIVMGILVMSEILMAFYSGPLKFFNALLFDRFFGAATGLVFSAVQLSLILYLFTFAAATQGPSGTGQPQIVDSFTASAQQSLLAHPLRSMEPALTTIFRILLPLEPAKYFSASFS